VGRVTTMDFPVRAPAERLPYPLRQQAAVPAPGIHRDVGNDYLSRTAEDEADVVAARVAGGDHAHVRHAATGPATALPATSGRPLLPAVRAFMEPRFGVDFGDVLLHTGPDADRAARGIGARAFTHDRDVYLRGGESEHDPRLMAHELTHVVQQRAGAPTVQRAPDDKEPKATDFSSVTMHYDGDEAVVKGDGKELFRFSAQSGRPVRLTEDDAKACGANPAVDSYMNDKRFVGIENYGPIPEGTYTFSPPAIERFDFGERLKLELGGVVGMKNVTVHGRAIHAGDWGTGRVALNPRGRLRQGPCGDVTKRSGFFLHGGILAGSSGCIDIGGHFDTLVDFLAGYRKPVTVTVEYTKPAPTVGFFTGTSGAIAYSRFVLGHGPVGGLGLEFGPGGTHGLATVGYDALLQWAGGALSAGLRLDIPFDDREAFVRFGLRGGLDARLLGPLYLRMFGGYGWESGGTGLSGPEAGAGLRLDLNRIQLEAVWNVLRPAAEDQRVHQALIGVGFRF
jgi:uncharacterized protein DUF4157